MRKSILCGRARQRGGALVAVLVVVIICSALSASVVIPNIARHRAAEAAVANERAFQLAEAGVDWAVATIRVRNGAVPTARTETRQVDTKGSFVVRYGAGESNGIDDDGDNFTDEADENVFVTLVSTGTVNDESRSIRVVMRKAVEIPQLEAAIQFNVEQPVLDLSGNAFLISGIEHELDATEDTTIPQKPGIGFPGDPADLEAQIAANQTDNIVGAGGTPSIAQVDPMELDLLMEQASAAATVVLAPGNHSNIHIGDPTAGGVQMAYCNGNLKLAGNGTGAGVLAVDGDLEIAGGFEWIGIIIVRGTVEMKGGGGGKRVIGALVVGEEVTGNTSSSLVRVTGTVDLLYSTTAVALASQRLVVMSVLSWQEVATP